MSDTHTVHHEKRPHMDIPRDAPTNRIWGKVACQECWGNKSNVERANLMGKLSCLVTLVIALILLFVMAMVCTVVQ